MRTNQKTKVAHFNYIGSIELPVSVAQACSHSGNCDDDVKRCMKLSAVKSELAKIDSVQLIKELKEYGAWTSDELSSHSDNLERILWLAAGSIQDDIYEDNNL